MCRTFAFLPHIPVHKPFISREILDIIRVSDWESAYDRVRLNSRLKYVNMNGIMHAWVCMQAWACMGKGVSWSTSKSLTLESDRSRPSNQDLDNLVMLAKSAVYI